MSAPIKPIDSNTTTPRSNDGYEILQKMFKDVFNDNVKSRPIFVTDLNKRIQSSYGEEDTPWDAFFDQLPKDTAQHYQCYACKKFFNDYASLVVVNDEGDLESAFLPKVEDTPAYFRDSVAWMTKEIRTNIKIVNVFYPAESGTLGLEVSPKGWTHFCLNYDQSTAPYNLRGAVHQFNDIIGKFLGDMHATPAKGFAAAALMLDAGKFADYQSNANHIKWLLDADFLIKGNPTNLRNHLWKILVTAPIGWINFRNTVVGEFLENASEDADDAYMKFLKMTDPLKYQRAQKDASENQLKVAMALVDKLGLGKSLIQRPARIDELRYTWKPSAEAVVEPNEGDGVKDDVNPFRGLVENKTFSPELVNSISAINMSWAKFYTNILPKAINLQVKLRVNFLNSSLDGYGFMTAVYPDAPPVNKHDFPEDRYPICEYCFHPSQPLGTWFDSSVLQNAWIDVVGIVKRSSQIREEYDFLSEVTQSAFFVLKGMSITVPTPAALFPPNLIPELYEIRAAIEHYSSKAAIEHNPVRG